MSSEPRTPATPDSIQDPESDRRRFLKAGLAVAPLIVTLTARPAAGQDGFTAGSMGNYASGATTDSFFPEG